MSVERSSGVRRALNQIRPEALEERITRNAAAERVVVVVERLGLRQVELTDLPEAIEPDDVAMVCWLAVLPGRA